MKYTLLLILVSFLTLSSCTVQKRRYSSGLHVNWRINLKSKKAPLTKINTSLVKEAPKLTASLNSSPMRSPDVPAVEGFSFITKKEEAKDLNSFAKHSSMGSSFKGLNKVANAIRKWEIVKRLSETQQITTPNKPVVQKKEDASPTYRKGVLSFIFLILSFALSVIGFILAWNSGSLLALILIALGLALFVMAIIYGIIAISKPKDKIDLAFGITTFSILALIVLLSIL